MVNGSQLNNPRKRENQEQDSIQGRVKEKTQALINNQGREFQHLYFLVIAQVVLIVREEYGIVACTRVQTNYNGGILMADMVWVV